MTFLTTCSTLKIDRIDGLLLAVVVSLLWLERRQRFHLLDGLLDLLLLVLGYEAKVR